MATNRTFLETVSQKALDSAQNIEASDEYLTITPDQALPSTLKSIYVGTSGDLSVTDKEGVTVLFRNVPGGTVLPIKPVVVLSAGTTASDLVGLL